MKRKESGSKKREEIKKEKKTEIKNPLNKLKNT